jgi:hypothetical protein
LSKQLTLTPCYKSAAVLQAATGVIDHLRAELEEARTPKQQKGKLATWLAKDKQQRAR